MYLETCDDYKCLCINCVWNYSDCLRKISLFYKSRASCMRDKEVFFLFFQNNYLAGLFHEHDIDYFSHKRDLTELKF